MSDAVVLEAPTRVVAPPGRPGTQDRGGWWIGVAIALLSVSYALALFTGQEWHSAYAGCTYKALHPESFPNYPYMTDESPIRRSSYYFLARLVGDPWLDDRFAIILFALLVVLALVGVDRSVRLLGATRVEERLCVLGLMAFGHRFRDNYGYIVTNGDFYAGTFAGVAIIWLLYSLLASAKLRTLVGWMLVLWSLTPKWAWLPTLITVVIVCRERCRPRQQRVLAILGLLGLGALYLGYRLWVRPPGPGHILLFDYLNRMEGSEGNPFLDTMPFANALYFFMLGLGWWITPPAPAQRRRMRTVVVIGAFLWLFGGLYLSYAPDALKIPYLIPLAFNGATQWPQYLLFLSISVGSLVQLRHPTLGVGMRLALLGILGLLYATFSPARMVKLGVMALVAAAAFMLVRGWRGGRGTTRWRGIGAADLAKVAAAAVVGSTLFAYVRGAIVRAPDLRFLAAYGVMGGHPSAKWVGVNEYVKANTPVDAVILPIVHGAYRGQTHLTLDKWLQTRTGRPVPVGVPFSVWFDYAALQELDVKMEHMDRLIAGWVRRDAAAVGEELAYFNAGAGPVDYLVLEPPEATWLTEQGLGYNVVAAIGDFALFRRGQAERL